MVSKSKEKNIILKIILKAHIANWIIRVKYEREKKLKLQTKIENFLRNSKNS